jgi:hypothetical protein
LLVVAAALVLVVTIVFAPLGWSGAGKGLLIRRKCL